MKPSISLHLILVAILFAGSATSLYGRTAQLLYFKAPKGAPKSVHIYQEGVQPIEVDVRRNNFSETFQLEDGETVLRFLGARLEESETFPSKAPSLKVPADYDKVLILAFSDPSNPILPIHFEVINANHDRFGPGDRMFINFTDNRIVGKVGRQALDLGARSVAVVSDAAKPKESYQVRLDRVDPEEDKPYTFIRQAWRQSPTKRVLIFVYSPPDSGAVTYYNAPVRDL